MVYGLCIVYLLSSLTLSIWLHNTPFNVYITHN